jgi:hypothetical protein
LELLENRCVPSTVTNLNDSGPGSLRDAIAVTPPGGTVDFQAGLSGTIRLTSGQLAIANDVAIAGPGATVISVSGNGASRVFAIYGITAGISGLTITAGLVTNDNGGGILNAGTLTLTNCTVSGNTATSPGGFVSVRGGGIENTGALTLMGSTVIGNQANIGPPVTGQSASGGGINSTGTLTLVTSAVSQNAAVGGGGRGLGGVGSGGGIDFAGATLTLSASTISGNLAEGGPAIGTSGSGEGGGIFFAGSNLTVTNSTIAGNTAEGGTHEGPLLDAPGLGGGIHLASGTALFMSSTLARNVATSPGPTSSFGLPNSGGGIFVASGASLNLQNSLIASNMGPDSANGPDILGPITSATANLIGTGGGTSGVTGGVNENRVGLTTSPINPRLGPLAPNGGPTPTLALLPGSLAIDTGDNALSPGATDQRGQPRIANREIDIGAFESQPPAGFVQFFVVGGAPGHAQVRRVSDGSLLYDFTPYAAPYAGSVAVAMGDVNGDGYPDVVTGAAIGNPHLKVYDGRAFALGTFDPNNPDASLLAQWFPYGVGFNIGANVAVGDVNGDGFADVVSGASAGNPDVRVYSGKDIAQGTFDPTGASLLAHWFAYGLNFNIGANVAVGDVNADGFGDVVTGATAGNPHIKVYTGKDIASGTFSTFNPDASLLASFFVHSPDYLGFNYGSFVAIGDVNGDGYPDLITGLSHSTSVFVYDGQAVAGGTFDDTNPRASELTFFTVAATLAPIGVSVGSADFDADGKADIITGLTAQSPSLEVVDGLAHGVMPPAINNIRFLVPGIQSGLYVNA